MEQMVKITKKKKKCSRLNTLQIKHCEAKLLCIMLCVSAVHEYQYSEGGSDPS